MTFSLRELLELTNNQGMRSVKYFYRPHNGKELKMNTLTNTDVFRMIMNAINSQLGSPGDVSIERTVDQRFKGTISDIPMYPTGTSGYLVILVPQNFVKIRANNDIEGRELSQYELRIYNGRTPNSTTALVHTNIFDDGHPCLGSGASAVHIKDPYDIGAYVVASVLRLNMTGQSFLSPTTRQYGSTPEQMQAFKERVRKMLRKNFGDYVVDLDISQIYDDIRENFNDQYRMYIR